MEDSLASTPPLQGTARWVPADQYCSDPARLPLVSLAYIDGWAASSHCESKWSAKGTNVMSTQTTMVPLNSETLTRAQAGDFDAFADIFNANKGRIYALCLRMTHNAAEAEDLTQDAFMHVFRKLSAFRGESALSTWLYRVAVNTVLMHFRKKVLHQVSFDERSDCEGRTIRRECGRNDSRLSSAVDRIALTRALQDLPAGYRMIFLLHDVHGYEHQEIADMLDCSTGNSKSQLHKARRKLRETLSRTETGMEIAPRVDSGGDAVADPPLRLSPIAWSADSLGGLRLKRAG